MGKKLIIIEAPGKKSKFEHILGKEYIVIPTAGHIYDLPQKKIGVDIKKDFQPTYEIMPGKKDNMDAILKVLDKVDEVFIMSDGDREGHGLGMNVYNHLPKNISVKRAIAYAITEKDIKAAIKNASDMNDFSDSVAAYECRRISDRLVGWKCSFITKQATGGQSAGRVQSVVLRLIAELEKEIRAFIPEEYWPIEAELLTSKNEKILATIKSPKPLDIKNKKQADDIIELIKKGPVKVTQYDRKEVNTKPYAPFTASSLIQTVSSNFGWNPDRIMKAAQNLYENSKCTYPRTDSTYIIPDFVNTIRGTISTKYGSNYLPSSPNVFGVAKSAQEAHEAFRVVDINLEHLGGGDDASKLYEMVWKRTVSSQSVPMRTERISAEFSCGKNVLGATGSRLLFDGWKKIWDYGVLEDRELPVVEVGDIVKVTSITTEQKMTQPPQRYSYGSMTAKLEKEGIGRPSTLKSLFSTLEDRGYIESKKNSLHATDLGIKVTDFLVSSDFCFVDIGFTSELEKKLDDIAEKKITKLNVLNDFWKRLQCDIKRATIKREEASKTDKPCPECEKNNRLGKLLLKHSRFGAFLTCDQSKDKDHPCNYKANLDKDGNLVVKKEPEKSDIDCKNCGEKLLIKISKRGNNYLSCRNWKDTKCAGFYDLTGTKMEFKKNPKWQKWKKKN